MTMTKEKAESKDVGDKSSLPSSDMFGDFWKVAVLLRRQDKSMHWQMRCAFKIKQEALDYATQWYGLAACKIIKPNNQH